MTYLTGGPIIQTRGVVLDNNSSAAGGPITQAWGVVLGNNSSARISLVRVCIDPQQNPTPTIPQVPPALAIESAYAFWTGPNEVGVSWQTNILSTGRVAWGVEPGRFIGYTDLATPEGMHGVRIAGAPRDQPLHITVQAVSAAGEILQMEIQGPSPQLAPAPPAPALPNVPLAIVTSLAAAGAVLAVRAVLSRRK